ncbi:MAG: esterase [Pseudomonadota bacterium]|nr:esterase [Pseudomonadota bacterium]
MKTTFLLAALLSGAAIGADNGPLSKELYVRGAFNGWGTDNLLAYKGKGVYETQIVISPGYHAFKVGYKDWSAEWVIDPAASVAVATGTDYKMDTHPGPEDFLFVKQTGAYRFIIDVSTPSTPVLRVERVATAPVVASDPHQGRQAAVSLAFATFDGNQETARFSARDAAAPLREYAQSSSMQLRDPGPQFVTYRESAELPTVRSGNLAFDALFALAGAEMKQDSVAEIRDGNYNGGAAIACDCFETGEKWHYVWTRDLSYAADLGLAMLDPLRVMHSLDFKLSGYRPGVANPAQLAGSADGLQIIQDTGSGGSWPVSTDRVTWAFGAEQALATLPAAERKAFAARALKALLNTIENDRLAAFDSADGLYTGEQSFLDWRDQTYAAWITSDIASLATSKALSTNVGHYKALTLAASLAQEQGQAALAKKYTAWAAALKRAINQRLWLKDEGMYSSLTAPHFDGATMHKFDWLGQALAIVTGVADGARTRSILARYPHGPMGAPVIWPQQQGMPVYHNRAMWPFVTAYGLKAAVIGANVSVADAAYQALMRGAALNLSNMENLEWLSGQPLLLDEKQPSLIGPVINSKRQLWSVGAYLGMVIGDVFGISASADGIAIRPFITSRLRRDTFGGSASITLGDLRLRDKTIRVTIELPPAAQGDGYYLVDSVTVNGASKSQQVAWRDLPADSTIAIRLGALVPGKQAMRRVSADPYAESSAVFGPREPDIAGLARDASGHAHFDIVAGKNGADVVYNVYRDGKLAAARVAAGAWRDRSASATACYSAEALFAASGNRSHHSAARCVDAGIEIAVTDARVASNVTVSGPDARFSAPRLKDWGKPADRFAVDAIEVPAAGVYQVQLRYHNGANQINLGISGAVKWLAVKDASGRVLARHVVQLPHARIDKAHTPLVYSTPLEVRLAAGAYRLELSDFYNMSYLQSNSTFSAAGGADGASNRFDIYGVRLLRVK